MEGSPEFVADHSFAETGRIGTSTKPALQVVFPGITVHSIVIRVTKLLSSPTLLTSYEFTQISNKELVANIPFDLQQ